MQCCKKMCEASYAVKVADFAQSEPKGRVLFCSRRSAADKTDIG